MTKFAIGQVTIECEPELIRDLAQLIADFHGQNVEVVDLSTGERVIDIECEGVRMVREAREAFAREKASR